MSGNGTSSDWSPSSEERVADRSREVTGQVRSPDPPPSPEGRGADRSWEVTVQERWGHQTFQRLQSGGMLTDRSREITGQVMGRQQTGHRF